MSSQTDRPIPLGALIVNAGAFVIPVALGYLFGATIKAINPSGVDVTNGLAYLRPILIVAMVLLAVSLLIAVVTNVVLTIRRHRAAPSLWILLTVQAVGLAVILVAQLWERSITGG